MTTADNLTALADLEPPSLLVSSDVRELGGGVTRQAAVGCSGRGRRR
jgi:hypothetical protein